MTYDTEFWDYLERLVRETDVIIDRRKDTQHPDYEDTIYPLDYGYLAGTTSSDGAGIDVWIGTRQDQTVDGIICTIDLLGRDSEIKVLLGCSEQDMHTVMDFLNQGDMRGLLIKRDV
ncbi:MAG: hypothetical protein OHK0046_21970 [Anaerolineae bacterium]